MASAVITAALTWPGLQQPLHAQDGTLDPTFGQGGRVVTDFKALDQIAKDVAIQGDGKIVLAGILATTKGGFGLTRYNQDGSLDTTFGAGGHVSTDVGELNSSPVAVAIAPDGKIVVLGDVAINGPSFQDFGVVRFNSDGSLDTTFGVGGIVITDLANSFDFARDVTVQDDGKIVVTGTAFAGAAFIAVARYNHDGTLDSTFDDDGRVLTSLPNGGSGVAVAMQQDGRIVVAAIAAGTDRSDFGVLRYETDGSLDDTFGRGGVVTSDFGGTATAGLAIQDNGQILVVGTVSNKVGVSSGIARYNTDGSPDLGFGDQGLAKVALGEGFSSTEDVAVQADGKIVVFGTGNSDMAVARVEKDGSLDPTFGTGGVAHVGFGSGSFPFDQDFCRAGGAIQADGRIVVAGDTFANLATTRTDFALARFR